MASSLATQLAQSASLNATLLIDKSRRKAVESYLFTGREADHHDLESIHALASNGLLELSTLNPSIRVYESSLLSDAMKGLDRTLLGKEASKELDRSIDGFLALLGPHLMDAPTGKVLEWLVRRFRINEFNVVAVLSLFLPWHESPHCAKMLTILHIPEQSPYRFLLPYKYAAQSIPRAVLVAEMQRNTEVALFVIDLLPSSMKAGLTHRTLVAFNAATLHDFIMGVGQGKRAFKLNEGLVIALVEALLVPLNVAAKTKAVAPPTMRDSILGSYILLSTLSARTRLTPAAVSVMVGAMAGCARHVQTRHFINAVLALVNSQKDGGVVFDETTKKKILKLDDIVVEVISTFGCEGFEKFFFPLLAGFETRLAENSMYTLLDVVICAPNAPLAIIHHLTTTLMASTLGEATAAEASPARKLLINIHQWWPWIVDKVAEELRLLHRSTGGDDDQEGGDSVGRLVTSLFTTSIKTETSYHLQLIIESASSSSTIRTDTVQKLVDLLISEGHKDVDNISEIHAGLKARLQDTHLPVLKILLERPGIMRAVLKDDTQFLVDHIMHVFNDSGVPTDEVLHLHVSFLLSQFAADLSTTQREQRSARAMWNVVASGLHPTTQAALAPDLTRYELLGGCVDIWTSMSGENVDSVQWMCNINMALAGQIADNILVSNDFSRHLDSLIAVSRDARPLPRVFAYLVMRHLLARLSGENQIEAAHRVLVTIPRENMAAMLPSVPDLPTLENVLSTANLSLDSVTRAQSLPTTAKLQASIIAIVALIPRPMAIVLDWFKDSSASYGSAPLGKDPRSDPDPVDTRCPRYVGLIRAVYEFANSITVPVLSHHLLRVLFTNLKEDALAFLAGILLTNGHENLRLPTLRCAFAFLDAHKFAPKQVDFQTILPTLLAALSILDVTGREATMDCISILTKLSQVKPLSIYGFDSIYGNESDKLQFLEMKDYRKYVATIDAQRDHLVKDPGYLQILHQQEFAGSRSGKSKENKYRQRVLCFILSHVNATGSSSAKLALLRSLASVSDSVKAELLVPTMQSLIQDPYTVHGQVTLFGPCAEDLAILVVSSFDDSTANDLNDQESLLWAVFLRVLRHYFKPNTMASVRLVLVRSLTDGLLAKLSLDRKVELSQVLLGIAVADTQVSIDCKKLLHVAINDIAAIGLLLSLLEPKARNTALPAKKRAKLDSAPQFEELEDIHPSLASFSDILASATLPGSFELIARLLETLTKVVRHASSTQADYVEQLLMSAIEKAADDIVDIPNVAPNPIRLDILVELIRAADNPQTFHQALLLMAKLARLAPDSVLHNVMPIFTFMGSNVFHRDDSYSFRVIQKTIDNIVPVVVSSLKLSNPERVALYSGARDFLCLFTDAAHHIPRHRRTSFFIHLVGVLGPDDFLAPVCMLLVDKVAMRVTRQNAEEAQRTLELAISVVQHYSTSLQIQVLTESLRESKRLVHRAIGVDIPQPTFLDPSRDEEHSNSSPSFFKRRAQALVCFVGCAIKHPTPSVHHALVDGGATNDLILTLIQLTTTSSTAGSISSHITEDISKVAEWSLNRTLNVMYAKDFIDASLAALECGESNIQAGVLDNLGDRLPTVANDVRCEVTPIITKILATVQKLLGLHNGVPVVLAALKAIKSIADSMCPGEEAPLTATIPSILAAIRDPALTASAMAVFVPLSMKLGPRILPYFRNIVSECVSVLRSSPLAPPSINEDTVHVLHGLLDSIPSFWSPADLAPVIRVYVEDPRVAPSLTSLMKALSKKVPTKVLLPTMTSLWPEVSPQTGNVVGYILYFQLLKKVLRHAERPVVLDQLRPIVNAFLQSFDIAKVEDADSDEAELQAISAFLELVIKLNEATFRPLFRRLFDWAFATIDDDSSSTRKATFCHVYIALLDFFKGLMTPYMSFLLQPFIDTLAFSPDNKDLCIGITETLSKSFVADDGVFWREDKLRRIIPSVIAQVPVCINYANGTSALSSCLTNLAGCITDDATLKTVNLGVLMHTRSEDSRVRLFALKCAEALWVAHGGRLIGFAAETATFIAECAEDENDSVVGQALKFKEVVEQVAGSITGL